MCGQGAVAAPAALGKETDGVVRPPGRARGRFFVPAGVGVDGVGMQSFFAVHGCADGGLLGSIKLSSKRGLDVEAATAMLRRSVQNRSLPDVLSRRPAS